MTQSKWTGKKLLAYMLIYSEEMLNDRLQNNTKLMWQIRAFEKMGLDVWYLLYCRDGIYICNKENRSKIAESVGGYRGFVHRHFMNKAFLKSLKRFGPFDYAYIRKMVALPSFVSVLKRLHKSGTKVILEIPTYSRSKISEDAHSGRWLRVGIMPVLQAIERFEARYIDLYVLIGEHEAQLNGITAININNGMNALGIADISERNHIYKKGEYHLLALGHMREYHGIDRIVEGMRQYYEEGGKTEIFLHIVGTDCDGCLAHNKERAEKYGLENRFILEGFHTGKELDAICDQCDAAFCAMAYYIKGGIIGNELKTREYMSRGIPFIISVPDDSLPKEARYILKIENNSTPIRMNEVIDFIDMLQLDAASIISEMQTYSLEHMTWIPEFVKVLSAV